MHFIKLGLFFAIISGVITSGLLFLLVSKTPRYTVSIDRIETPEIGDQIIVKYPSWISEEAATKSFKIMPETKGELVWLADQHELMFFPEFGFDPSIDYRVKVISPSLFATIEPLSKTYTFKVDAVNNVAEITKEIYTPQITNGKYIDVNLKSMVIALFQDGQIIKTFPLAGKGGFGYSTPVGNYKILRKEPKHFSSLSKVWMPWSLNFRSDGYYLHGWPYLPNGKKITTAYSHGCVRLFDGDDKELYDWAEIGTPVIIHSSTLAAIAAPETSITDGDLVREGSKHEVYLIKIVGNKKFKRHILTSNIEKWYPHLSPFAGKVKLVNDGALNSYLTSRWIKSDDDPRTIYEIDSAGTKHLVVCNNGSGDCLETWSLYGWDTEEIYIVNSKELNFYPQGESIQLKLSPALSN